jgi:integrase
VGLGIKSTHVRPGEIRLQTVLDYYRETELSKLAGERAQAGRLKMLEQWFGNLSLDELDGKCVKKWLQRRLSGMLGSGRNPDRSTIPTEQLKTLAEKESVGHPVGPHTAPEPTAQLLTKHQKHWRKKQALKHGIELPVNEVFPVSSQTARHELVLLRKAINTYFDSDNLLLPHRGWLKSQYILVMDLPLKSDARTRRVSNDEIEAIFKEITSKEMKSALALALLTSLRRSELMSLRWEDVDLSKCIVKLRKPGHKKSVNQEINHIVKSKTTAREVPLLPGAIILLQQLGMKKSGLIIPYAPGSFSQAWRRAADKVGSFDARLHDCRREAISRLIELFKLDLASVAVFSGHADLATLHKYYVQISPVTLASTLSQAPGAATMIPSI